jgi:hypothetical protein
MKPFYTKIAGLWMLLLAAIWSCKTDAPNDHKQGNALTGNWLLRNAERNGKPTETLEGVFLQFQQAHKLTTNLPDSTGNFGVYSAEYAVKDHKLTIQNRPTDFAFSIEADTLLKLGFNIAGQRFDLYFAPTDSIPTME